MTFERIGSAEAVIAGQRQRLLDGGDRVVGDGEFENVGLRRSQNDAVIEIRDNGTGMSEEFMRSRLFKPFETTKSAGMGVGVFESREYIQELGGRLDVASRVGEGTTFTMTLPLNGARAGQRLDEQQEESV
jgi:signal transduction histidine kinase